MKKNQAGRVWKGIGKCVIAGILAFCLVSVFSFFYYNPPVHVPCDDGATDYKREENVFWSRGAEGFCGGRIDGGGYNNSAVPETVDVLYMGSSHSEGLYVNTDETYCYLLNELFENTGVPLTGYNLGMSSHAFARNVRNLPYAAEKYHPRYIVMETQSDKFTREEAEETYEGEAGKLKTYTKNDPLYWVQKNPYVKLLYLQVKNYLSHGEGEDMPVSAPEASESQENRADILLEYISAMAKEYDFIPIIYFQPKISLAPDGQSICADSRYVEQFAEFCEQYGIRFIDMTEAFERNYQENYIVPTGFSNTAVGYGHINRYGHRIIAEELYPVLKDCAKGENK